MTGGNSARTDPEPAPTDPPTNLDGVAGTDRAALAEAAGGNGTALDPGAETDIWTGRTRWQHYTGRLALWLVGNIIVIVLVIWLGRRIEWLTFRAGFAIVVVILLVSGLEMVVRRVFLNVLKHRYRLTTQRLFIERGILSRTVDQTELIRVDDVRLYKGFLDRAFGLGSVAVVSTDATDREVMIEGIAEPEKVAEEIRTRMRTMRRKSLFVENL